MVTRYTSEYLYHIVGLRHPSDHDANYEILLKILDDGAVTHPPHDLNSTLRIRTYLWNANIEKGELIVPQVTCFCDIPFEALPLHLRKYGSFGISFPRFFLVRSGARPVIYIPLQSNDPYAGWGTIHCLTALRDWMAIREGFYEQLVTPVMERVKMRTLGVKPDNPDNAVYAVDDFLTNDIFAFMKVFDSDLTDDGPENYYMEREWRLPGNLKFQMEDVANVIVHKNFVERLAHDRPAYASKIISAPYP